MATTILCMRHAVAYYILPGNHFVALGGGGGGGGGVSSGHKCKIQLNVPPFIFAELRCKKGGRIIEQVWYMYKLCIKTEGLHKHMYMYMLVLCTHPRQVCHCTASMTDDIKYMQYMYIRHLFVKKQYHMRLYLQNRSHFTNSRCRDISTSLVMLYEMLKTESHSTYHS